MINIHKDTIEGSKLETSNHVLEKNGEHLTPKNLHVPVVAELLGRQRPHLNAPPRS